MSSPMGMYGGVGYRSPETKVLSGITPESFDYRDEAKTISKLIGDVSFMAGMQRKMQKGIDDANQNFVQQLQSLINDFMVILGGGGDTGFDWGDFKYVLQAVGALFGFEPGMPLPINLFQAAWHFFSNYILPGGDFSDVINMIIDGVIASTLDIFGEIPIVGQAVQQLAQIISAVRDAFLPLADAFDALFSAIGGDPDTGDLGVFGDIWNNIVTIFGDLTEPLADALNPIIATISTWSLPFVSGLADSIEQLANLISMFTGGLVDLLSGDFDPLDSLVTVIESWFTPTGLLLGNNSPLNVLNLFGILPDNLLGSVSYSHIGDTQPNLLTAPTFDDIANVQGGGIWTFDGAVGHTTTGSVKVVCNGTDQKLVSNKIPVTINDKFTFEIWNKWSGLTYTGTPFRLQVVRLLNGSVVGTDNITAPTSPATNQSTWLQYTNTTYSVPSGCDQIVVQFFVSSTATAGSIWWDDAVAKKTGLLQMSWTENLVQRWEQLAGLFGITDTDLDGDIDFNDIWQSVITTFFNGLADLFPGLMAPQLVGGHGGIDNLTDVVQAILDKVFPGASGRSFADLANKGTDVANTADMAAEVSNNNAADLAVRNNNASFLSIDPTAQTTCSSDLAFASTTPYTFAVTRVAAAAAVVRAQNSKTIGTINWVGYGNTNITGAYWTVYKVNQTNGTRNKIYQSADVSSLMNSGTTISNRIRMNHDIPSISRFDVLAGDAHIYELKVTGTNDAASHTVVGLINSEPIHPSTTVWPSKNGEVRNSNAGSGVADSGTTSPSSLTDSQIVYSNNIIWAAVGIADGDIAPPVYTPRTFDFQASGTFTVLPWMKYIDIICNGAGQGGADGTALGANGVGGNNGNWATATYEIGVDVPLTTTSLTVTIGAGGTRRSFNNFDGGNNGGNTTVTGTGMTTVTGTGGSGGNSAISSQGVGGDDHTYNGVIYVQGDSTINGPGNANGNAPGGGGEGGPAANNGHGGNGARGEAWIVGRSS